MQRLRGNELRQLFLVHHLCALVVMVVIVVSVGVMMGVGLLRVVGAGGAACFLGLVFHIEQGSGGFVFDVLLAAGGEVCIGSWLRAT